jgi:TfoX/Sxy family transcriptional regulator of competence genes
MKLRKSPPELIATFDAVMPGPPAVRRLMFGFPAGFINGNMFMGLFEDSMILRLSDGLRDEMMKMKGARAFAPMAGRVMKAYVVVPDSLLSDRKTLSSWVSKALTHGESLQPKEKKKSSKTKAKKKKK